MEPDAKMVLLSDVAATKKRRRFTHRTWSGTDYAYIAFMVAMHGLCLLAPATFSWPMVALFAASYLVTGCLGITLSFHRQLSHKAFATPKWLEYAFAYCGVLAIQARSALGAGRYSALQQDCSHVCTLHRSGASASHNSSAAHRQGGVTLLHSGC